MDTATELSVIVVGAGPSGLAAAAHHRRRNVPVVVLEAGPVAGAAVREWGHVRLFSTWSELVDPTATELLAHTGWISPEPDRYPTGAQWADEYLQPLADLLGNAVRYDTRVTAVTRAGRDRLVSSGRETAPFTVHVRTAAGERTISGRAVIDASGTWSGPNPLGSDGVPAIGESAAAGRLNHRIPDLTDPATRERYAGKHVLVAGTGASAKGALIGLVRLAAEYPNTRITWVVRRPTVSASFAGGGQDELRARGELGQLAQRAVTDGPVDTIAGFRTKQIEITGDTLRVLSDDGRAVEAVDEIIALTGFRPDLTFLSELRLDLDPVLDAPRRLAPLIDPNEHSCGTVYPHGVAELAQLEPDFYLVGMKSYGRATSFLTLTGYEQTRSVAAAIAGDHEAATRVELTLPETGVCGGSGDFDAPESTAASCCGSGPLLLTLEDRASSHC